MVTCRCCWRVHFVAFGFAVFRQLICFVTLSPPVVLIASRPPRGSRAGPELQIAVRVRAGPHWQLTRRTGVLHAVHGTHFSCLIACHAAVVLFSYFFSFQFLVPPALFVAFHVTGSLPPAPIYFMVNFGFLPPRTKSFLMSHIRILFPAGCGIIACVLFPAVNWLSDCDTDCDGDGDCNVKCFSSSLLDLLLQSSIWFNLKFIRLNT